MQRHDLTISRNFYRCKQWPITVLGCYISIKNQIYKTFVHGWVAEIVTQPKKLSVFKSIVPSFSVGTWHDNKTLYRSIDLLSFFAVMNLRLNIHWQSARHEISHRKVFDDVSHEQRAFTRKVYVNVYPSATLFMQTDCLAKSRQKAFY